MPEIDSNAWLEAWSELMGTATAFRRSCLLFAGVELGVFPVIAEEGARAEEVANAIAVDIVSTRTLLNALVAVKLLGVEGDRYTIDPAHRPLLLDGPATMLPDIRRVARENDIWLRMAGILKGAEKSPVEYSRELLDGRIACYPGLMRFNRLCATAVLDAAAPRVARARRILDLGGGDGNFAGLVLRMNPSATVTVLEIPGGADHCAATLESDVASGRLRVVYGDARDFQADAPYDLILVNELLELFNAEDKQRVVHCAAQALAPGGAIVLVKFTLDEPGVAPASSAVFSMRMRLKSESYLESDAETLDLLRNSGCEITDTLHLGPLKSVIVATRPHEFPMCEYTSTIYPSGSAK